MLVPVATLAVLVAAALGAVLWLTRVPPAVPATVTDDPALPRLAGDGVSLHGRVMGPEGAPLVIVLHGGPGDDHRSLLALEALAGPHRVLLYDQRGAGLSERVAPARLRIEDHLADLDALTRAHADGPVLLIGHSWGAMLATAYLGRRPAAVSRAVLIEPGFLDRAGYEAWEARRAALSRSPRVIWAGLAAGFRARGVSGDADAAHDSIVGAAVHAFADHPKNPYHCPGRPYDAPSWRFGGRASDAFWADVTPALDAMARGLAFPGPVLILAGGCNDWTGAPLQGRHVRLFADARLEVIAGAGHDVVWDRPQSALEAIRRFAAP
jgi:proline iminopeptidase